MLNVGCWMLNVECWMLNLGCWMLNVGILVYELPQTPEGLNVDESYSPFEL